MNNNPVKEGKQVIRTFDIRRKEVSDAIVGIIIIKLIFLYTYMAYWKAGLLVTKMSIIYRDENETKGFIKI